MAKIVFHVNESQPHQLEHSYWLSAGLRRHGLNLTVTPNITQEADIHIVSGPHYAKEHWIGHPRVILLDRAYYHELKSGLWKSMDYVSLGWMNEKGGRNFSIGTGRQGPEIRDCAAPSGTIFLADYGGPIEAADTIRRHPQDGNEAEPLEEALKRHKTAIGYGTTALVRAGLLGLETVCKDERNLMYQPNWLDLLPYADWEWSEIESGEAWEHLKHDIDTCHSTTD